ncbi:MAG: DUF4258 domain-containing protein [Blastocatellia bacterium]
MFQSILIKMRRRVRAGRMTLTIHAREEMYNDRLTTDDLGNGILAGAIVERQWDEVWREWKYVVAGEALDGRSIEIVAKLGHRDDTLIITVYRLF